MTVIAAVKKDDVIYMCADCQTSTKSGVKRAYSNGINRKLTVINDNTILAGSGYVARIQYITAHPEWFYFGENGELTKEFLVTETVPCIYKDMKDQNLLFNKQGDEVDIGCDFLVVWKNRMFEICSSLNVIEYRTFQAIGSGDDYALYKLKKINLNADINKQLVEAAKVSTRHATGVGAPFILLDSKNLEVKVVEE